MKITIPNERPISWNKMYSGQHWAVRQAEAERVHLLVLAHTPPRVEPFKERVDISIVSYFKNRPLDPDNISSKLYIDGLKGRVIRDDTREYIRKVTTQSEVDAKNPRIEIEITPVK